MKEFLQGNVAVARSAIANDLTFFSFYPITPSTEVGEELVKLMSPDKFINAFSEVEVINHLYGASSTGARCMTATSGCGLSLMREGLSYAVGSKLPMVIYDVMRFSPGLGGITPSNEDISLYWAVGHGESKVPILTPSTGQELADCIRDAFDLADILRLPVIVMVDAILAQGYENIEITKSNHIVQKDWQIGNGKAKVISSRKIMSYKACLDEQSEQVDSILMKEDSMYSIIKPILKDRDIKFKYNSDGKYITAIGITGRVIQEFADKYNMGYIIPILFNPMTIISNVYDLTVVEIGGTQLRDIMKYNYPLAKIKHVIFEHKIPDVDEVFERIFSGNICSVREKNVN